MPAWQVMEAPGASMTLEMPRSRRASTPEVVEFPAHALLAHDARVRKCDEREVTAHALVAKLPGRDAIRRENPALEGVLDKDGRHVCVRGENAKHREGVVHAAGAPHTSP